MLNRKELFHRNLIEEQHETPIPEASGVQNNEVNGTHPYVTQNNNNIGPSQVRGVSATETLFREDAGLSGITNGINIVTGNRSQSSNTNQRLQNNK